MKKTALVATLLVAALAFSVALYARGPRKGGNCREAIGKINIENVKKFLSDSSSVRDEMAIKRIELMQEKSKEKPNRAKLTTIQKDMIDLKSKVEVIAEKSGLPVEHLGCMMMGGMGGGPRMMGGRGMGKGMGPGTASDQ